MPLHFGSDLPGSAFPETNYSDVTQSDRETDDEADGYKIPVVWHGSFFLRHSLALVNRELTLALLDDADFADRFGLRLDHFDTPVTELQNDPRYGLLASRIRYSGQTPVRETPPAVTIRHRWPPEMGRTESGKLVVIQPWEFGSLPSHWISAIRRNVDEVWVPSQFVRDTYLASGVPGEKVVVVPNGVNTRQFYPGVGGSTLPACLRSAGSGIDLSATYKFLFVGGTIARKGIDVLLDAYDRAFTAQDPVVLIIKDFGTNSFYANQGAVALIRALQAKPNGAKILYLNQDLSEAEIAALYGCCDCLVHPYRGEGYGLPIAEAMACGKPTLVTNFGAALDFANSANAYLIPAEIERMNVKKIGDMATVDYPYWAQPNREALSALMRHVVAHPEEARARGERAALDIAALHTWDVAARVAFDRLSELTASSFATGLSTGPGGGLTGGFELPFGMSNLALGGLKLGNLGLGNLGADSLGLNATGDMYEDRKQAALAEARASRWQMAAEMLEGCLLERPDDWDVVNALAAACFRIGNKERAYNLLYLGIGASPNTRDLHHNLAFILLADDRAEEALEHALLAFEATREDPNLRRTVQRAQSAILKRARHLLRGVPDRKRAQTRRSPAYRDLMERYERAEQILKEADRAASDSVALAEQAREQAREQAKAEEEAKRPTLSLCMIVKNEERFLRNCLESAHAFVDEIVIVDTGSTDGTLDIAREYGAKIVDYVWNDDFSEARNLSLQHATGRWALWLDADEEIASGSGPKFREAIQKAPDNIGGYMVTFHNWLTNATRPANGGPIGGEMAVHHACRLFRRLEGVKFEGRIHEQNLRSLQAMGYGYARTEGLLIDHFGYAGEIMTLRNKHERFIRMLTREVEECPDEGFRYFHLFNLANSYFTFGDMENAVRYFSEAAEGVSKEEEFAVMLYVEWATALQRLRRPWEGLDVCARADELGIRQAGVEFARGYCLLHTLRYEEAEMAFRTAIAQGLETPSNVPLTATGDAGASSYKAQYGLALALVGQDRYEDALQPSYEALERQPNMVEARFLLSVALTNLDRTYEATLELETLLTHDPQHADARRDLGILYMAAKDYEKALPHLRSHAWSQPDDTDALGRLASCCEHLGLYEEARDHYERLRLLKPDSVEVCVNLGRVLAALDDPAEALDCYTDAIRRAPSFGNAYFNAGDLLYRLGFYDRAAETYLAGLGVSPEHESGFFVLGNCYFRTQAYAAAVASYRQALALSPTHQEARNNLQLAEQIARELGLELPA